MKLLAATTVSLAVLFSSGFARSDLTAVHREKGALPCLGECVPAGQYRAMKRLAAKRLRGWDRANRRIVGLQRTLRHSPSVTEAINLACAVYGNCSTLWRRARCESHLFARAHNASGASGLFQFLPNTWRSTPFGGFSIWSPYANALAAGWMMGPAGRGGEWSCR